MISFIHNTTCVPIGADTTATVVVVVDNSSTSLVSMVVVVTYDIDKRAKVATERI
jgi:hypothetical protein